MDDHAGSDDTPLHDRTDDLARQADDAAFTELYRRLAPALHVWASLRIRPSQMPFVDPEDVVQEVWCRALRVFPSYDAGRVSFRAWIFCVAKNVLLEATRRLRRSEASRRLPEQGSSVFALDQVPDDVTTVSRRVARDESVRRVIGLLAQLPPSERDLVVWCGIEELGHGAVASMLGISQDAVSKRWQRLRSQLEGAGIPEELLAAG